MKNKFVDDMCIDDIIRYKKPIIVTMSGLPGAGKTYFAQELSRNLKIFLLSNDYIRNYYLYVDKNAKEDAASMVNKINRQRMIKLLVNKKSFVCDFNLDSMDKFEKFALISNLFNYDLLKVKINSDSDETNIKRISDRMMNYDLTDNSVIGDNVSYSRNFPREIYDDIRKIKCGTISDDYYDYVINNNGTKNEYKDKIDKIIEEIRLKLTIKGK